MILRRVAAVFKAGGAAGVLSAVVRRLRTLSAGSLPVARAAIAGHKGLEIGGPSPIFARGGLLSLYPVVGSLDNCNFAGRTLWEGELRDGGPFVFQPGRAPGRQIVAEGADLSSLATGSYDFVLSSHMLEHTANPLRALAAWKRLLVPGGTLVLVLPHRDGTFDHRRPLTTLEHLAHDFDAARGEDDETHVAEILALHDVSRDDGLRDMEALRERAANNLEVRSLHHHVFNTPLAVAMVRHAGFLVISAEPLLPYHIIVIARSPGADPTAEIGTDALGRIMRASPFPSDHA